MARKKNNSPKVDPRRYDITRVRQGGELAVDISSLDAGQLSILRERAARQGNVSLYQQATRRFQEVSYSQAQQQNGYDLDNMTSNQVDVLYNNRTVFWQRQMSPEAPQRSTLKVGDWVEVNQDFPTQNIAKGAIGRVSKVGTKYVYVHLEGMNTDDEGVRFDPEYLDKAKKAPLQELNLSRVIMPDSHREAIHDTIAQLKHSHKIFQDWGFDEILEKGKAISMLFYGQPGTGKTLCAEMIAQSLGKKLEVIGTGEIQSSEPGQAERNIKAYFEKSKPDTILLFDECDSLVHSRNNTGSIMAAQINALLTALEHYEGIVIFTTNRLGVLDEAFNRRLSLKLEFPMPTVEQRLQIWKGMFPKKCPLSDDIQWEKLAAIELTGGYIKNIVLRAARSAAAAELKAIDYATLKKATEHEVMSKREFEHAARQYRRGGVTTIDQAVEDYGVTESNTLEIKDGTTRTSTRPGKEAKDK